jgi:hypothetical protein
VRLKDLPADVLEKIAHLVNTGTTPSTQGINPDAVLPVPNGYNVLVLQYVRPETIRTAGGMSLILAATTQKEDAFQGRLGIVLALGADAYQDSVKFPNGAWVQPGDIVAWPALENASSRYPFGGQTLAAIPDDRLVLKHCDLALMVGR